MNVEDGEISESLNKPSNIRPNYPSNYADRPPTLTSVPINYDHRVNRDLPLYPQHQVGLSSYPVDRDFIVSSPSNRMYNDERSRYWAPYPPPRPPTSYHQTYDRHSEYNDYYLSNPTPPSSNYSSMGPRSYQSYASQTLPAPSPPLYNNSSSMIGLPSRSTNYDVQYYDRRNVTSYVPPPPNTNESYSSRQTSLNNNNRTSNSYVHNNRPISVNGGTISVDNNSSDSSLINSKPPIPPMFKVPSQSELTSKPIPPQPPQFERSDIKPSVNVTPEMHHVKQYPVNQTTTAISEAAPIPPKLSSESGKLVIKKKTQSNYDETSIYNDSSNLNILSITPGRKRSGSNVSGTTITDAGSDSAISQSAHQSSGHTIKSTKSHHSSLQSGNSKPTVTMPSGKIKEKEREKSNDKLASGAPSNYTHQERSLDDILKLSSFSRSNLIKSTPPAVNISSTESPSNVLGSISSSNSSTGVSILEALSSKLSPLTGFSLSNHPSAGTDITSLSEVNVNASNSASTSIASNFIVSGGILSGNTNTPRRPRVAWGQGLQRRISSLNSISSIDSANTNASKPTDPVISEQSETSETVNLPVTAESKSDIEPDAEINVIANGGVTSVSDELLSRNANNSSHDDGDIAIDDIGTVDDGRKVVEIEEKRDLSPITTITKVTSHNSVSNIFSEAESDDETNEINTFNDDVVSVIESYDDLNDSISESSKASTSIGHMSHISKVTPASSRKSVLSVSNFQLQADSTLPISDSMHSDTVVDQLQSTDMLVHQAEASINLVTTQSVNTNIFSNEIIDDSDEMNDKNDVNMSDSDDTDIEKEYAIFSLKCGRRLKIKPFDQIPNKDIVEKADNNFKSSNLSPKSPSKFETMSSKSFKPNFPIVKKLDDVFDSATEIRHKSSDGEDDLEKSGNITGIIYNDSNRDENKETTSKSSLSDRNTIVKELDDNTRLSKKLRVSENSSEYDDDIRKTPSSISSSPRLSSGRPPGRGRGGPGNTGRVSGGGRWGTGRGGRKPNNGSVQVVPMNQNSTIQSSSGISHLTDSVSSPNLTSSHTSGIFLSFLLATFNFFYYSNLFFTHLFINSEQRFNQYPDALFRRSISCIFNQDTRTW